MSVYTSNSNSGLDPREWNALIGIITAIVGNTLISFALNIQRYAHVRLSRDRQQRQRSWRRQQRKRRRLGIQNYGTQLDLAEERSKLNRTAPDIDEDSESHQEAYHADEAVEDDRDEEDMEADERAPLRESATARSMSDSTMHPEEKDEDEAVRKDNYLKSPLWWLGIILMTTGEAGNFIAYGFAPASIVSPLGVVALVSNCIIAPVMLKETFRQRDFWGVLIAIGGAVTVVLSARMTDPKLGPDDIWKAISRLEFELYLGITALAIVVLIWASGKYGHKSVFIDLGLVGLFGGYTALSTKGVASLLTDTIWRAVTFPVFYLLVFVLVATAIAQIRYVNKALQRFDSTRVVPTQFVCFTISVIVGSAILYREFESTTKENVGKFVGGCALTFFGVYLITSGKRDQGHDEEYDEETGEIGGIRLVDDEDQGNGNSKRVTDVTQAADPTASNGSSSQNHQAPQRTKSDVSEVSLVPSVDSGVSPLTQSPWSESDDGRTLRASTSASTSEPVLPLNARLAVPETPKVSRSGAATPNAGTPQAGGGSASHSRKSMNRLLPGPISSPLSSSLSAIVADQLRRGVDTPASVRGSRKGLYRTHSNILDAEHGNTGPADESALQDDSTKGTLEDRKARTRSLSGSLGDIFNKGGKSKARIKDRQDVQDGGSGDQ